MEERPRNDTPWIGNRGPHRSRAGYHSIDSTTRPYREIDNVGKLVGADVLNVDPHLMELPVRLVGATTV